MADITRALINEALIETAARWQLRLAEFGASIPEQEARSYREWLHASPDHLRASLKVKRALDAIDQGLDAEPARFVMPMAANGDRATGRGWKSAPAKAAMAMAACLVMAFAGVLMFQRPRHAEPTPILISAAPDRPKSVTLVDGSRLSLDRDSLAEVTLGAQARRVALLRGQVRVAVAPDRRRPFIVTSGRWAITALGTEFNVETANGGVSVYLAHGKVAVRNDKIQGNGTRTLEPGDMLSIDPSGKQVLRRGVSPDEAFAWQKGLILFNDEPLGSAVGRLQRHGLPPFIIDDPRVARMKISGVFRTGSREGVIEAIDELLPVAIHRDSEGIHLTCRHSATCN